MAFSLCPITDILWKTASAAKISLKSGIRLSAILSVWNLNFMLGDYVTCIAVLFRSPVQNFTAIGCWVMAKIWFF